jgi:hypothetical protein
VASENRKLGLKAIQAARAQRARSKIGRISGLFLVVSGVGVALTLLVSWFVSTRSLAHNKEKLLSEQHAAVSSLGTKWDLLREKIETFTLEAAGPYKGDFVDPMVAKWDFRFLPGIYLRVRIEDAANVSELRKAIHNSVKDAFTGCLLRETTPAIVHGDADANAASAALETPWNLRKAYSAARVLTDEWASLVRAADDKIRLSIVEREYDKAKQVDLPALTDMMTQAEFYLLVLDEDLPANDSQVAPEELQVPHPARVLVMNLKTGAEVVRLRRVGNANVRVMGDKALLDSEVRAAMRRQANNCVLANEVWSAISTSAPRTN